MVTGSPGSGARAWPNSGKASDSITAPPLIDKFAMHDAQAVEGRHQGPLLGAEDVDVIGDRRRGR